MPDGDFPIQDWLRRALQYPSLVIKDFRKGGTRSLPLIHFQVENLVMADAVVRYRHRLKAASFSEDKFAMTCLALRRRTSTPSCFLSSWRPSELARRPS